MVAANTIVGVGAAVGAAFVGYCIYFDYNRRKDPDYKKNVRERRAKAKQRKTPRPMPDISDPAQMQSYFLQEVQLGEELLAQGDYEAAVDHLASAVFICGSPQNLLQILQQTTPPQVFNMLMQKIAAGNQMAKKSADEPEASKIEVIEDDDLE